MTIFTTDIFRLIVVVALFPVAVIGLGEIILRLQRNGRAYASSVQVVRNVLLPLLATYWLVSELGKGGTEGTISKLFLTAAVIIGLTSLLGVINGIIFEKDAGTAVPKLFLDLGRILIVSVGIALTLSYVWGADLSSLATALGVSSIVLGLALQDTLGNLFNGITLINERPFRVGDYIEVDGFAGQVVEVNWRAVRMLTRERDLIVLPHMKVSQSAIVNHSRPEVNWAQKIMMGFSYDVPPNTVKRVMLETMAATPGIMADPVPEVKVDEFADSAVVYEVEYYIESFGRQEDVKNEFMTRVWYAAKRNDIDIPFPQLNIHREPQREKITGAEERDTRDLNYAIRMLGVASESKYLHGTRSVEQLSFGEGETILNAAFNDPGLYFIISGEVQLSAVDAVGVSKQLSEVQRGDFITQILRKGSRNNIVTAMAREDTKVIYFPERIVRRLVNRHPGLAIQIEEIVSTRRKQFDKVLGNTVTHRLNGGYR